MLGPTTFDVGLPSGQECDIDADGSRMMDCESCGRYRPTAEVVLEAEPDGSLVWACARCRHRDGGERPWLPFESPPRSAIDAAGLVVTARA